MRRINEWAGLCVLVATAMAGGLPLSSAAAQASAAHHYGRSFLLAGQDEAPGYRTYRYVLLGASAEEANSSASGAVISAYLALDEIHHVGAAAAGRWDRQDLDIVYFPLREAPPSNPNGAWLLAHYDYSRARTILDAASITGEHGIALVSCPAPLAGKSPADPNELVVARLTGDPVEFTAALDKQLSPSALSESERGNRRLTGRAFLRAGEPEGKDYGLYSYVLFGEPLSAGNRDLYKAVLEAFFHLVEVGNYETEKTPHSQLNITYLPLNDLPSAGANLDWYLDHYDFARAQIILSKLMDRPAGPYIVSYQSSLSGASSVQSGRLLIEDLSHVPPDLAFLWVKEFTLQAGNAQYWDKPALRTLMLNLRTQIAVEAEAFEEVRAAYSNVQTALASRIKIQE